MNPPHYDNLHGIGRLERDDDSKRSHHALGSVDIHVMARKAAERWMNAQKLVSVLS
jgi:hypothetical protein